MGPDLVYGYIVVCICKVSRLGLYMMLWVLFWCCREVVKIKCKSYFGLTAHPASPYRDEVAAATLSTSLLKPDRGSGLQRDEPSTATSGRGSMSCTHVIDPSRSQRFLSEIPL